MQFNMNAYPETTLVGELIDPDLLAAGAFVPSELVEIGYEDPETGEPTEEESPYVWIQTYGTWNPHIWNRLTVDQVKIHGREKNWRKSKYEKT